MAFVRVHGVLTTPEWWEIAGYHPRKYQFEVSRNGWETVRGLFEDDGTKSECANRKPSKPFSVSFRPNANLADVARFLGSKVEAGEDLENLIYN
jgi:hypothetical protein